MNKKDLKQIAQQIKEKRKSYGYNQEQMSEKLEMSYSYYTKIENGSDTFSEYTGQNSLCPAHFAGQTDLWKNSGKL